MSQDNIYELNNVLLGYHHQLPVLKIDSLNLVRGNVYFIIGPSGVGKSTLLESLGLMSNTFIINNQSSANFIDGMGKATSIKEIWNQGNKAIAGIRKAYFSFLFQNNFLMPNFTVGENMSITSLMKISNQSTVDIIMADLMARIELDQSLINRRVSELSGGQKQRVAFLRALMASYEVLFADEPTGNLDPLTARMLMRILRDELKQENKTAVLVSHDTKLAIEFADAIIPIKSVASGSGKIGSVSDQHIFLKKDSYWADRNGMIYDDFPTELAKLYSDNEKD